MEIFETLSKTLNPYCLVQVSTQEKILVMFKSLKLKEKQYSEFDLHVTKKNITVCLQIIFRLK